MANSEAEVVCGYCNEGWPIIKHRGGAWHSVPEPQCQVPCACAILPLESVKKGEWLVADGGFTCLKEGEEREVRLLDEENGLFVECADGQHYLDGQVCEVGEHGVPFEHYIGFYKKEEIKQ